ncbi:MAG: hypothetical protein SWH68_03770 [Thermodesulfobacteriota bacterium]|nr:hypothetical protein [Thermodesulfobacteriota bacterium]
MKLMQISFHFEFTDRIEAILDSNDIQHYVRYSMIQGKDSDGKHFGNQIYPGSITVIQAQVPPEKIDDLFDDLRAFKIAKNAHQHLEALVLPIEQRLT